MGEGPSVLCSIVRSMRSPVEAAHASPLAPQARVRVRILQLRRLFVATPLTGSVYEHMFVITVSSNGILDEERLASIERGARERHTLVNRVLLELVEEVRRLRETIARMEER